MSQRSYATHQPARAIGAGFFLRRARNEGKLRRMIRTTIAAVFIASPAFAGMQCSEYVKHIDLDIPASIMFDVDAVTEFVATGSVVIGIGFGIEIARPDLEGINDRLLAHCRENLNADAFEFIKQEIER